MSDASSDQPSSPLHSAINATPSQCVAIRSPDASRMCSAWAPPLALDLALLRSLQSFNASSLPPSPQLPSSSSTSSFESPADALDQALVQLARESYLSSRLARPRASCRPLFDLRYAQSYWCAQILSLSHARCNGTKLGFSPPPPVCLPTCMAFADSVRSSQCAGSAVTALARCSFAFPAVNEPCIDGIRVEASTCGYTRPNAIGCKCQGIDPSKYPCVKDPDEPTTPPPNNVGPPGSETSAPGLSSGEPHNATTIAVAAVSAVVLVTGVLLGIILYRRRQQRTKLRAFSVPVRDADLVSPALLAAANGPMPHSPSSTSLTLGAGGRHDLDGSESPKPSLALSPRMSSVSPPVTSSDLTLPTARPTSAHLMDASGDLADHITPPSMAALAPLVPSTAAATNAATTVAPGDLHGNLPSRQSSLSSATGFYPTTMRRKSPIASRAAFAPDPTTMSLYAPSEVSSVFANPIPMKVVALFSATRSDEIAGIAVGDMVRVYKTYVDNWCLVLTEKDEEGYMPLACLEASTPVPSPNVEFAISPLSRPLAGTLVIESPTLSPIPSSGLASTTSPESTSPTSRLVLDLGGTRRESLYLSQDDVGESWSVMEQLACHDAHVPPVPAKTHESQQ